MPLSTKFLLYCCRHFIGEEETVVSVENHRPAVSHLQTNLDNIRLYREHLMSRFDLKTLVAIGTDCIGSCKSNYHTITTAPEENALFKTIIKNAQIARRSIT